MKRIVSGLSFALFLVASAAGWAQTAPATPPTGGNAGEVAAAPAAPPSQLVQPALNNLVSTLDSIRLEKWKTSSTIRQGAEANLQSVRRDLDSNLPSLLHAADESPASLPAVLPAASNLNALYDVVLRVAETARVAAPSRQSGDLDAALANLEQARRALNAHILATAQANQAEAGRLRQALASRPAAPPPPAPAPCPKPAVKKHVYRKRKAPTPAPASAPQ